MTQRDSIEVTLNDRQTFAERLANALIELSKYPIDKISAMDIAKKVTDKMDFNNSYIAHSCPKKIARDLLDSYKIV